MSAARTAVAKVVDRREHLRRLVPADRIDQVVRRRVEKLWRIDAYREQQEGQMRHLVGRTDRAGEVPELARRFAEHTLKRTYLRWHPERLHHQEVRDIEWLTTRRDKGRSTILSFMHHNWYEGLFVSLDHAATRTGHSADITILISPLIVAKDTPTGLKQHAKVVQGHLPSIPALGGTDHLQAQLRPGMTMVVASDLPGHSEVEFLGRRVLASSGAALMATRTDSPIVMVTNHHEGDRSWIQVHEPIEPGDFADPKALLQEVITRHGHAVLDWPEVLEMPRARFGIIDG